MMPAFRSTLRTSLFAALFAIGALGTLGACGEQKAKGSKGGETAETSADKKADETVEEGCYQDGPACLPPLDYKDTTGKVWTPDMLKGKVVIINFWATWCKPCQYEIPDLAKVQRKYKDKGVVLLGFMSDSPSDEKLKAFSERYGLDYPVIRVDPMLSEAFGHPNALPTNFVYDKSGRLMFDSPGAVTASQLESEVKSLL